MEPELFLATGIRLNSNPKKKKKKSFNSRLVALKYDNCVTSKNWSRH